MRISAVAVTGFVLAAAGMFAQSNNLTNNGQAFTGEIMDSQCALMGSHAAEEQKLGMGNDPAQCSRQCVQNGAAYVLFQPGTKTVYKLNNQAEAARYAGRNVKINGNLQPNSNEIIVVGIAPL